MTGKIRLGVLTPLAGIFLLTCLPARADPEPRNHGQITSGIVGPDKAVRFVKPTEVRLAQLAQAEPAPSEQPQPDTIRILVTGEDTENTYYAPESSIGTLTPTLILEVPQSIQVIPQQILEDQQALELDDALRNISGASVNSTEGRGFQVSLRGFDGVPVFRDGFRLYSPNDNGDAAGQSFPEIASIERIEVLRGPASALFGQIDPGGAINIISKKPLDEPFVDVELQIGSDGLLRPRIDLSGPMTSDQRLLYRLNAVYLNDDGFRDFDEGADRLFISPALAWRISDRTDLNLQLEYLDDQRPYDSGLVALGDGVANIPRDRILGEPDDEVSSEYLSAGYTLEHRFSDRWMLRNGFRYIRDADDISATLSFPFIGGLNEATGELNRVFAEQAIVNKTFALQTNLVGEFNTGPIGHAVLFGIDWARYELESDSFTDFSLRAPINIFDPVYGAVARPDRPDTPFSGETINTDSLRVYVQDQIKLLKGLSLVAGLSYETLDQRTIAFPSETESTLNEDAFSPRVGLVYQPIANLSLYGNYSRSFIPNSAITVEGNPLAPEEGEGFEIGLKTEWFDRRLLATLAYFNLTKQNVATADPNDPRFSVATGEQQSQGIELDIIGEILPGWNLIASYSYIDAEVTEDNRIETGNQLPGVPEHSASVWTTYEVQSGALAGLGLGIGFNWVGARQGDLANSFDLDSYFLTNAAVSYRRDNWRFALNIENLFDVNYVAGTPRTRTRGLEPGDPLTMIGSVSYQF